MTRQIEARESPAWVAGPQNGATRVIAYFTMEIALEPGIPTYSGGLGVLAGDTVRAAADLGIPMIVVTLLHRMGYFTQVLDAAGGQTEQPTTWRIGERLRELPARSEVTLEGRPVAIRAWERKEIGIGGASVRVLFLDTDLPANHLTDRRITDILYGGDARYRLCQEVVLGVGGVRMLRALGHRDIMRFHMNEGHAALLAAELLREQLLETDQTRVGQDAIEAVRRQCVFTTHTPVPAGHDKFSSDLVRAVVGRHEVLEQSGLFDHEGMLNMTYAALNLSHFVNGVAKRHGEVSRKMFGGYPIESITNGVHVATWAAAPFQALFDRHVPGWRSDNASLRFAVHFPAAEVWEAHARAKHGLIELVNQRTSAGLDVDAFTIGFARRATAYKRPTLLVQDPDRLAQIAATAGSIQVIYAGKAHPHDEAGKQLIRQVYRAIGHLKDRVKIVYLADYDVALAKPLTSGVDLWLNTPEPPLEASGTSGMKAAVNGVPSLSILDGWWVEGCIEGITGWGIAGSSGDHSPDAAAIYDRLQHVIVPMFYRNRSHYISIMQHAIALNASFFNAHRMLSQYVARAYSH